MSKPSKSSRKFSLLGCCSIDTVEADAFSPPPSSSTSSNGTHSSSLSIPPRTNSNALSNDDPTNPSDGPYSDENNNHNNSKDKKSGGRSLPRQWTGTTGTTTGGGPSTKPTASPLSHLSSNPLLPSHHLLKTVKDIPPVRFEEPSAILSEDQATSLQYYLPSILQGNIWTKLYSLTIDGASLDRLLTKIENTEQILLVIQDNHGAIFGAYFNDSFKRKDTYYGTRHSWLFTFENRKRIDPLRYDIAKSLKKQVEETSTMNTTNDTSTELHYLPLTTYGEGVEQQTVRSISTIVSSSPAENDINQLTLRSNNSLKNNHSNSNSIRNMNSFKNSTVSPPSHTDTVDSSIWTVSSRNLQTVSGGVLWSSLLHDTLLNSNPDTNDSTTDDVTIKTLPDVHIYKATTKNNLYHYLKLNIHSVPVGLFVGGGEGSPAIYLDEEMEHCCSGPCATYLSPPLGYQKSLDPVVTNPPKSPDTLITVDDKKDAATTMNAGNDAPMSTETVSPTAQPVTSDSETVATAPSLPTETTRVPRLQDLGEEISFTPVNVEVFCFRKVLLKSTDTFSSATDGTKNSSSTNNNNNNNSSSNGSYTTHGIQNHHGLMGASIAGIGTLGVVGALIERPGEENDD